jgi:hypothetical protein
MIFFEKKPQKNENSLILQRFLKGKCFILPNYISQIIYLFLLYPISLIIYLL